LGSQSFRSASSIGANYREANRSRSKADFRNKIRICESEASETFYWLEIIEELGLVDEKLINPCLNEAKEFLAIFTTISNKLNSKLVQ
jgi:four helix bundle protein